MKFNHNILSHYLSVAPISLAFERYLEAQIYQTLDFKSPILDVGCGDGLFAKMVFSEKLDTGIDPDSKEIERAREVDAYQELIQCRGDKIDKPDNYYQTVFSNSVLEHIPDIDPVLREVYRLLKPGGSFYIAVPSDYFDKYTCINLLLCLLGLHSISEQYRNFFNRFWKHYHYYSPEHWSSIVEKHGFRVKKVFTYGSRRTCLINDFFVPFAFFSLVIKKTTNRWVLFPQLRKFLIKPIAVFGKSYLTGDYNIKNGGLVFMELVKP
ncbi:class I SAM-dependent methyltransferase [Cylindrospermopsis raciborskii]|uniref:class I SAM-dependent methyltransferase n=1 Tax=Cylindrospermopsis raciborskii TaxID=77022 RepID=UPI0011439D76|nr:class I SAM-dependent methyltransferase [Cylindrospermopsis raciborskii]TPX27651.1 class I SAM-dependent methyltransferase [Cylindrospermopsis raciborskii GIHE 2018]